MMCELSASDSYRLIEENCGRLKTASVRLTERNRLGEGVTGLDGVGYRWIKAPPVRAATQKVNNAPGGGMDTKRGTDPPASGWDRRE